MTVVTFEDFTPLPRYDNRPWTQVKIQEAATADGPWTDLETKSLSPVDVDPKNPATRDFTTELATLAEGWYRLIFIDATGDQQQPTQPIHNIPDVTVPYQPLVSEVANLILARTKDTFGNEVGTFTASTRPNYEKVLEIIDQAADDVTMGIDTDIPEGAYDYVRQAIALRAAMIIERSYYPEQINNNRSPYPQLESDYEYLTGTVDKPGLISRAVERESQEAITGEASLTNRPSYSFPDPELRYRLGRPL